ncbi:hypothetical protein DCC79_08060 [bacterium]|nr:hypothetical protein [Chloroflexi bacterium CFX6]RIL10409.1 MAG: hypothetical protein DCC79_08060 [bacterium]
MNRVRVAGLTVVATGLAAVQGALRWLAEAYTWDQLSRPAYAMAVLVVLGVGLPVMASGVYLVHKGRVDDARS